MKSVLVWLGIVAIICLKGCRGVPVPTCVCDHRECEVIDELDCPGLGVIVWDPCKCCQECARTEGEPCGGDLGFSGSCEPGLSCQQPGPSPAEGIYEVVEELILKENVQKNEAKKRQKNDSQSSDNDDNSNDKNSSVVDEENLEDSEAKNDSVTIPIDDTVDIIDGKQKQANSYAAKKTVAQGMMDIALITANANQLRYIIEFNSNSPTFYVNIILICFSLFLQVAVGMCLIFKGGMDLKGESKTLYARRMNNCVVIGVFMVTIINVFVASFTTSSSTGNMVSVGTSSKT